MEELEARYSLPAGEGDGAILGLAAGDTAGGAWELGYSAVTEQVTVLSYQLIEHLQVSSDGVAEAIRELDGAGDEEPVYRSESPHFRRWLDRAAAGSNVPEGEPSIDPAPRAVPFGVAFREEPERLIEQVIESESVFHNHAPSILGGVVVASAVAASCFAQAGRDLIAGVSETAEMASRALSQRSALTGIEELEAAVADVAALVDLVGVTTGSDAMSALGVEGVGRPWDQIRAGLLVSAPVGDRDHVPLEQAARIGGSPLGAAVGGIVGARVGIRAWPWAFANDTWFAEVGRRLARGSQEVADLPIPYAVEQHLISGERRGFH